MKDLTLQELFDAVAERVGFNVNEWKGATKISTTFGAWGRAKTLMRCHNYLADGKEILALIQLNEFLDENEDGFRVFQGEPTTENLAAFAYNLHLIAEVRRRYTAFTTEEYPRLLSTFHLDSLYAPGELLEAKIPVEHFLSIQEIGDAGWWHGGIRVQGKAPITDVLFNYRLSKNFIVTDSPMRYLGTLPQAPDTQVAVFFVIENPIEYSYFLLVVQYEDYTWVYTDALNHENPHTKGSSRRPERRVEDKHEKTSLPYRIINEVETWRKENKSLTKGVNSEFYDLDIKATFTTVEKLYLQALVGLFLRKIKETANELPRLVTVQEYVAENRLLASGEMTVDPALSYEESKFKGWFAESQAVYQEVLEGLGEEQGLIRVDPEQVVTTLANWLSTPAHMANMAVWTAFNSRREAVVQKQKAAWEGEYQEQRPKLANMIIDRLESVLGKLTVADQIVYYRGYNLSFGGREIKDGKEVKKLDSFRIIREVESSKTRWNWPQLTIGWNYSRKSDAVCLLCRDRKISHVYTVCIPDWKVFCWLLDIDRFDLPPAYRTFNTKDVYVGNTILQNTHPLARIEDLASQGWNGGFPNGFTIDFHCCKTCFNRIRKANYRQPKITLNELMKGFKYAPYDPPEDPNQPTVTR